MEGTIHVRVLSATDDGFRKVQIKRLLGSVETREFSPEALKEYLERLENYCIYKSYKLNVSFEEESKYF